MIRSVLMFIAAGFFLAGCTLNDAGGGQPTPEATQVALAASTAAECDALIERAMENVGTICDALDINQACYGNRVVEVSFREGASETFQQAGDIVLLSSLQRLRTAALDPGSDQWGIVLLRAQASLAGTLPGQAVTIILFGDTELGNPSPEMIGLTLRTGVGSVACQGEPPPAMLIQSPTGERVTLTINGAEISVASTIHIRAVPQGEMTVATIEGRAEVTAFGETRVVVGGEQTSLPIAGTDMQVSGAPSEPVPFDIQTVDNAFIDLVRQVEAAAPAAPTAAPGPTAGGRASGAPQPCVARADWRSSYRVQSGDTLSQIAARAGVSLAELQQGNCIDNPDQIAVGQTLRVPRELLPPPATFTPQPTLAPTATPAATATTAPTQDTRQPGDPNLRADGTTIVLGDCAQIAWDIVSDQMYFEGQPASGGSRQVCPQQTTTYTLLVIDAAGSQIPYRITITVEIPPAS